MIEFRKLFLITVSCLFIAVCGCSKDNTDPIDDGPCASTLTTAVRCEHILAASCDSTVAQSPKSVQCLGIAKSTGERCKNKTKNAWEFCNSHTDQNIDGRCPLMTKNTCRYCDDHKDLH